jgi:hypothetical protein
LAEDCCFGRAAVGSCFSSHAASKTAATTIHGSFVFIVTSSGCRGGTKRCNRPARGKLRRDLPTCPYGAEGFPPRPEARIVLFTRVPSTPHGARHWPLPPGPPATSP